MNVNHVLVTIGSWHLLFYRSSEIFIINKSTQALEIFKMDAESVKMHWNLWKFGSKALVFCTFHHAISKNTLWYLCNACIGFNLVSISNWFEAINSCGKGGREGSIKVHERLAKIVKCAMLNWVCKLHIYSAYLMLFTILNPCPSEKRSLQKGYKCVMLCKTRSRHIAQ